MASQTKTSKFNKKILVAIMIIIVIVPSASAATLYMVSQKSQTPSKPALPSMSLTLVGADGQHKVLNQTDIAALQSYTDKGGFKTSGGLISGLGTYTGVPVTELLNLVGGISSGQTLNVTASDGYSMVFTYDQTVNCQDFTTYDSVTGNQATPTQPMKLVLTYYLNGTALASGVGPLRIGVLGPEGLLTKGHYWVKLVTELQVIPNTTP